MSWFSDFSARNPQARGFGLDMLQDAELAQDLDAIVEAGLATDESFGTPQPLSSLFSGGGFDNSASFDSAIGAPGASLLGAADLIGPAPGDSYVYGPSLPGAMDDTRMPPIDQGKSNACGSSSLAMIMDYLGVPVSRRDIDKEIRRVDQGLPPQPLIDFAREHGLEAEFYNHGSWDEIKGLIGRGIPVQAQINTEADGSKTHMHWVAVVGFRTDPKTGEEPVSYTHLTLPTILRV